MRGIRGKIALGLVVVLTICTVVSYSSCFAAPQNAKHITVDGNYSDWDGITKFKSNNSLIREWSACVDDSRFYFIVEAKGNEWGSDVYSQVFTFDNGKQFQFEYNAISIKGNSYSDIANSLSAKAPSNHGEFYYFEASFPLSYIGDFNSFTVGNTTVTKDQITYIAAEEETGDKTEEKTDDKSSEKKTYSGISVDGNFDDWLTDVTPIKKINNNDSLKEAAAVWDGDYLYVYLKENPSGYDGNINGATPNSNGTFVIQTDKNEQTTVAINYNNGANISLGHVKNTKSTIKYGNHMYEMAIPVSEIKGIENTKYLNFGIYEASDAPRLIMRKLVDIKNPGKPHGGDSSDDKEKTPVDGSNINIDGKYSDWKNYPRQVIDYTTAGTHDGDDACGSLIFDTNRNKIFGYVEEKKKSFYQNHVSPICIRVNGDHYLNLACCELDSKGNMTYSNVENLAPGTYRFALVNSNYPVGRKGTPEENYNNITNINHKYSWERFIGSIYITMKEDGTVQAEYELDAESVAKNLMPSKYAQSLDPLDPRDMQYIEAQYIELGTQWIGTAGVSSGPFLGILLCIAVVGVTLYSRKKKESRS